MTDISICIPTYNRRAHIESLVMSLLTVDGASELCVYDDGSTDGTFSLISAIDDPRLRLMRGEKNSGRAQALQKVVHAAAGTFVMVFDDDDMLYPQGLRAVLENCASPLPVKCTGWIYHLEDDNGDQVGSDFTIHRSNFVALRADHAVTGDKKEVVRRTHLLDALAVPGAPRRIPTSLYWTRIALSDDVLCKDMVIGKKNYLNGGMSDQIKRLKSHNPYPLFLLARARVHAYKLGRYKSMKFLLRSVLFYSVYRVRSCSCWTYLRLRIFGKL
jgi:glycosyltransferase involved in cell wall biosynthesis